MKIKKSFFWFDPMNNDPQFIQLLSEILEEDFYSVDFIGLQRKVISWNIKGKNYNLFPTKLDAMLNKKKIIYGIVLLLLYLPAQIRAILILLASEKKLLYSNASLFPFIDAIVLKVLNMFSCSLKILVHRPIVKGRALKFGIRSYFSRDYEYITLSEFTKSELTRLYQIPPQNISVIPHPTFNIVLDKIEINEEKLKKLVEWKNKRLLFLYFGNLSYEHGLIELVKVIEACIKENLPYVFMLMGNYNNRDGQEIKKYVTNRFGKTESVRCSFGYYTNEELKNILRQTDAVLIPYLKVHQSGVKSLSLGQGVPVVVNNVGGLREGVIDGLNGVITKDISVEEWLSAFNKIKKVVGSRDKIRFHAENEFGDIKTVELFINIFKNI